ncbi:hypothetical protein EGR_06192 [Echinococcus granulosus]|uniref:Uncharacterized protein n=1 Tax=Echinococcus granulosus TaxID=6210 RepID=W6UDA6_ECHGR|nr:hypothetical protein EGR_06192 [Echinococcus granulosus]EUB58973.1 hypothetical protein EGR_06192 [Echinococcus granulosus]
MSAIETNTGVEKAEAPHQLSSAIPEAISSYLLGVQIEVFKDSLNTYGREAMKPWLWQHPAEAEPPAVANWTTYNILPLFQFYITKLLIYLQLSQFGPF